MVEGRDIGTVVCPDAALKIYLTAEISARAARRDAEQDGAAGGVDAVAQSLSTRDEIDTNRTISPLSMATDAVHIDSTELTLDETVERIWELLSQRSLLGLPIVAIGLGCDHQQDCPAVAPPRTQGCYRFDANRATASVSAQT